MYEYISVRKFAEYIFDANFKRKHAICLIVTRMSRKQKHEVTKTCIYYYSTEVN